jgi:hypothetical protein
MSSDIQLNEENIVIACPEGLRVEGRTEIAGDMRAEKGAEVIGNLRAAGGAEVIGNLQVTGGKTVSMQMTSDGHETYFRLADDGIANLRGNRVAITNSPVSASLDLFPDGQVSLSSPGEIILHGGTLRFGSTEELRLECNRLVVQSADIALEFKGGAEQPIPVSARTGLKLYLGGEPGGPPIALTGPVAGSESEIEMKSRRVTDLDDPETCSPAEIVGDILISWTECHKGDIVLMEGGSGATGAGSLVADDALASVFSDKKIYLAGEEWVTYKVSVRKMWRRLRELEDRVAKLEGRL